MVCVIGGLSVAGCQMGMGLGKITPDAELARQILTQSCEIGEWHSGGGPSTNSVLYIRHGKVNKRSDLILFHFTTSIKPERVYIHSLKNLKEGWIEADASFEGNRENLYFNKQSGEFTCSTDEWRAVHAVPESRTFEVSPLIMSAPPQTTHD